MKMSFTEANFCPPLLLDLLPWKSIRSYMKFGSFLEESHEGVCNL